MGSDYIHATALERSWGTKMPIDLHNPQRTNLITPRVDKTSAIGFIAGMLTTAGNVPQVLKSYRTRSAEGLFFKMLVTLALGLGTVDDVRIAGALASHRIGERGGIGIVSGPHRDEISL
jgi:hypothetical protein